MSRSEASGDYVRETLTIYTDAFAKAYRAGDERTSASREHYSAILEELSSAPGGGLSVLDIGCGTGRYFHCLKNVRRLVGIDVSPHMLEHARDPVHRDALHIESIELLCGDIFELDLEDRSFDLVYSIGVIAEFSPLDATLLDRLFRLLRPGGKVFLTAVDLHSRMQMTGNKRRSFVRGVGRRTFPMLPSFAKSALNHALSSYYLSEKELTALLRASPFADFSITRYQHTSGWQGAHFDCLLTKAGGRYL